MATSLCDTSALRNVLTARELGMRPDEPPAAWSLDTLAGRFIELTGGPAAAGLTAAAGLVLEAQRRGEPVAWLVGRDSAFYPPDLADWGIDLEALPVVRIDDAKRMPRVADTLLRSGGFALLIMDLGRVDLPFAAQTRLAGLAKAHRTALVRLVRNRPKAPLPSSLASLRGEAAKQRAGFDRFACTIEVHKDKRAGAGWRHVEVCRGPDGLC